MTEHIHLNHGDRVHQGFFTAIQQLLGSATPSLRVKILNSTTLTIVADDEDLQSGTAIKGKYRWVDENVIAALPGGLASGDGTGHVYVTASDNDFTGPVEQPDQDTDYSFGLEIRASGDPTTDLWRKVGEVVVVDGEIQAYRPWGGGRPSGEFGLVARADTATTEALRVEESDGSSGLSIFGDGRMRFADASEHELLIVDANGDTQPGLLENDNVAADADIAHAKLADAAAGRILIGGDDSRLAAKEVSGDATLNKDGQLTVGEGAINRSKIATGNPINLARIDLYATHTDGVVPSTGATVTFVSTSNLPPGIYLVIVTTEKSSGVKSGLDFETGSGVIQQSQLFAGGAPEGPVTLSAVVVVLTTAKLRFRGAGTAGDSAEMSILGVKS